MNKLMQYEREHFYHPLTGLHTIRLLILYPGQVSDPVSIQLQVVERATAPAYDAISYVWGDPTHKRTIVCDGRPFEVTVNLFWALIRIRSPSTARILWADAICINQSDLQERSNQVTFMGSLYENAAKVYICMGDAQDGHAFQVQTVINDAMTLKSPTGFPILPGNHPLRSDKRWYALGALTNNPWFGRAWVVQEAALARDPIVLYGRAEFKYRDFVQVLRWLNNSQWAIRFRLSILFIHLEWADWRTGSHDPAYTFVDLLSHAALLNCSDPRDKVYAFLGHPVALSLTGSIVIKPDYEKTPGQVFLELSTVLIKKIGLRVLTTVEHTRDTIVQALPSWVTRWDLQLVMNDIFRVPNASFFASANLAPGSTSIAGDNLVLQGILLDAVRESFAIYVSEISGIRFENTLTGAVVTLRRALEEFDKRGSSSSPYQDQVGAFCATLCIGASKLEQSLKRLAACLAVMLENGTQVAKNEYSQEEQDEALLYYSKIEAICTNRTFIITRKGYYGLAPLLTRPGDVSCVIVSVDVPFILRPQADTKFKLLGESYIHGIMEGQVRGMTNRKVVSEQSIVIC